jgi:predicted ATPase/class 3 adenylate cyclase
MTELPVGTVTFLFTDIEGSTRLIQQLDEHYSELAQAHNRVLRETLNAYRGIELRTEGDSFFYVFRSAVDGVSGAAAAQQALAREPWPAGTTVRVRMGLHTGEAALVGHEYVGLDVHRAARIASVAHGGQVLISETTRALVEPALPPGLRLRDLGPHRLKDLARSERIFQLLIDGLPTDFPPLKSLDTTPNNLPNQLTSFIGRTMEIAEGRRLLDKSRLLTLTGPGGTGKTRLSLQIAADALDRFPDGVFFVPLAAVRDPELVPSAITQALALSVRGSRLPMDALLDHLHNKRVLLVLDNFEQLLEAAPVAAELLQASPDLKVLVSSRAVLHLYGEQEYPVPPLGLPDPRGHPGPEALSKYEAVQLFIERAVAVRHDFQVTNENAPAVASICERVDGLPLAIELAAARIKLFSPEALLSRLEKSLSVLGTGARDLSGRQQTLRGAIAWSVDLLDEGQRRRLGRFAVFARGADLEQAEQVCGPEGEVGGPVLDTLDQLADQSLLRRVPDYEEPRFVMLQVIREFGLEQLDAGAEAGIIRERHARAYLDLARRATPHYFDATQKAWLDRLERDHDNFRAALDWWVGQRSVEAAMELGGSLWRMWQMRGHLQEGRTRLEQLLAMPDSGQYPQARRQALEAAGGLAYWQADMTTALKHYSENLALTRATGDPRALADALYNDAFVRLFDRRERPQAYTLLQEALRLFRELNDEVGAARVLWAIGVYHVFNKDFPAAIAPFEEAASLNRQRGDRFGLGWALRMRGVVAIQMRDAQLASTLENEALQLFADSHDVSGIVMLLGDFAAIAVLEGDRHRAALLAAAEAAQRQSTGAMLGILGGETLDLPQITDLSEAEKDDAEAEARAMTIEEATAIALRKPGSV